ncbi:unnamed protein product [Rotaria magnacalcarata]|uniref:Uncharacterized protein n=1 Tax=Rotaria magnacalcarata TaxID=392030 RepID=A0A816G8D9_9BILA|nr:unnamed protein product [Rotaria magnacalcarata]CAF4333154.1 unnamed protein product [Rotaria magnacalcarata]
MSTDNRSQTTTIVDEDKCGNFDVFDELVNELFSNDNYNDDNNVGENNDPMNQGYIMNNNDDRKYNDFELIQTDKLLFLNTNRIISQSRQQSLCPLLNKMRKKMTKTFRYTDVDLHELIGIDIDKIPHYLSNENKLLEEKICAIRPTIDKNHLEELHQIAILIYVENTHAYDDETCQMFIDHCLQKLNEKNDEYRHQLRFRTSHVTNYSPAMECTIEKFIQHEFKRQHIVYHCQITLVLYHYIDEILKRHFYTENPNIKQKELLKRLCKYKYEEKITEYEFNLFKNQISEHCLLNSVQNQHNANSSLIVTAHSAMMQEKFFKQYAEIESHTSTNKVTISLDLIKQHMHQCQKQFNNELEQMWHNQRTLSSDQRLTSTMLHLIDQRLANIDARLECIYKFKAQLLKIKIQSL